MKLSHYEAVAKPNCKSAHDACEYINNLLAGNGTNVKLSAVEAEVSSCADFIKADISIKKVYEMYEVYSVNDDGCYHYVGSAKSVSGAKKLAKNTLYGKQLVKIYLNNEIVCEYKMRA